MKIENKRTCKKEKFGSLNNGDVFYYDGRYCMKVIHENEYNAVSLATASMQYFDESELVTKLNAKLVIED